MLKDEKRDLAVKAFRNYARLGLPSFLGATEILFRLRGCCDDKTALDMIAVYDTLRLLEFSGKSDVVFAIRDVYFATANRRIKANEMSDRIRRLAFEIHCDERTIYRRLACARELWHFLRSGYDTLGAKSVTGSRASLIELCPK